MGHRSEVIQELMERDRKALKLNRIGAVAVGSLAVAMLLGSISFYFGGNSGMGNFYLLLAGVNTLSTLSFFE